MARTDPRQRRVRWPVSVLLLVLLMVACTALGTVLSGSAWWWATLVVAAAVLFASAGFRYLRVPAGVVPLLSAGVLVALLTVLFGAGTGLLWILPTGETLARFADLTLAGIRSIQTQGTPADVLDGILFLLAVGVGVLALLMDTLALGLRWPAMAGIPTLVPLLVPGFVIADGADWSSLVATAAAFLILLRVEAQLRPTGAAARTAPGGAGAGSGVALRGTLAIATVGIVGALLVSVTVPVQGDGGGGGRPAGSLFGAGINPMIELGQDLRRPEAGPALHYRTTAAEQPYFALLTLDDIKGTSWLPRAVEVDPEKTVEAIDAPPGLAASVATNPATTTVTIDNISADLLPVPVPATRVTGLTGDWYWDNDTRAIRSPASSTTGQRYTVTSLEVQPTREELRSAGGRIPVGIEPNLELPPDTPPIIEETARAVTAGTESNYDAAVALQDYLRGNDFSYDTEAPVEDDYDGGGAGVIATFLEEKRGYCVHFASAMALMARTVDIPARITLGYLPGTRTSTVIGGLNRYNVDSHDLHAWPELYFAGVGWVPFEPTPGRGSVPDYALPESADTPGAPAGGAAPSVAPRALEDPSLQPGSPEAAAAAEDDRAGTLGRIALIAAAVALLSLVPGLWRRLRRRRRRARLAVGRADATLAWRELTDTVVDHGVPVPDTVTARELAADIRARAGVGDTPSVRDALDRLLVATERTHYARTPAPAVPGAARLVDDLDIVLRAVTHGSGAVARLRAVVMPASLSAPLLRRMGLAGRAGGGAEG